MQYHPELISVLKTIIIVSCMYVIVIGSYYVFGVSQVSQLINCWQGKNLFITGRSTVYVCSYILLSTTPFVYRMVPPPSIMASLEMGILPSLSR